MRKSIKSDSLIPIPNGRFETFYIEEDQDILSFIEDQGIIFKPGNGFYQLTKSVKVQQYKEIILFDRYTEDFFTGPQVRKILGLQPQVISGGIIERLNKSDLLCRYDIFIQSSSYNRKLLADTKFIYEVEDWDGEERYSVPINRRTKVKKPSKVVKKKILTPVIEEIKYPPYRMKSYDIPPRLKNAAVAYTLKFNNPFITWNEVARISGYKNGSSAQKASKKIEMLKKSFAG